MAEILQDRLGHKQYVFAHAVSIASHAKAECYKVAKKLLGGSKFGIGQFDAVRGCGAQAGDDVRWSCEIVSWRSGHIPGLGSLGPPAFFEN